MIIILFSVISRGSSPGAICRTNDNTLYSRINKSNSSSLIKESTASNMTDEDLSLTWLQKQQKKLEERRNQQRRREHGSINQENSLIRELKTSLDRARSETTDGYAASEVSIMFSEDTSTRESSPHKNGAGGSAPKTSTPKTRPSDIASLTRHVSDSSFDRSRPLIQRRLRYDSEGDTASQLNGSECDSRPITPGFPTVPPTPIFGQSGYE